MLTGNVRLNVGLSKRRQKWDWKRVNYKNIIKELMHSPFVDSLKVSKYIPKVIIKKTIIYLKSV